MKLSLSAEALTMASCGVGQ